MRYSEFAEVYEKLGNVPGRLEKIQILAEFLKKLEKKGNKEWIYLLKGKVFPDYDSREYGISNQLVVKAIGTAYGIGKEEIEKRYNKVGDFGKIAEEYSEKKKQSSLFNKPLDVVKVFENLKKIMEVEGKGAVEKKITLITELLVSAKPSEAKYIIRTLLQDLKIGMGDAVIKDALIKAFFSGKEGIKEKIDGAYDLSNDYALLFESSSKGEEELEKIVLIPGRPLNVMLAVKVENMEEAFENVGRPAAIEEKYDGFRMIISKDEKGDIQLFTRRLENVTKQFPDVVEYVKRNIKGESFILDSEIVGYDPKNKKYRPFEAISQRIRRKYDIEKLIKELPVEVNVFDVLYYNKKVLINEPFVKRRKIVEKIVKKEKFKIRPSVQIITDKEEEAMEFYHNALKIGEEGIMIKALNAPYKQGRRVGYMCKLKPIVNDLDLVIVGAEYGSGKRAGWLTSYIVACKNDSGEFLEVGKVSSGLKEKEEEGTSYDQMTKLLKPLIEETKGNYVKVKPKLIVAVTYQNIQESPSYSSGYALRFPRITAYRSDRGVKDIARIDEIKREVKKGRK